MVGDDENESDAPPDASSGWDAEGVDVPDDVSLVTEVADMIAVFAAQRFRRIEAMRRHALDEAEVYGGAVAAVV